LEDDDGVSGVYFTMHYNMKPKNAVLDYCRRDAIELVFLGCCMLCVETGEDSQNFWAQNCGHFYVTVTHALAHAHLTRHPAISFLFVPTFFCAALFCTLHHATVYSYTIHRLLSHNTIICIIISILFSRCCYIITTPKNNIFLATFNIELGSFIRCMGCFQL